MLVSPAELRVSSPVILLQQEHIDYPGVVFRHSEVDESNMASRIHHPVPGVVIPMRWNEGQSGQVHSPGD